MTTQIGQRSFTPEDQKKFAHAVGDWNPIHMDPLAARRTPQGAPIVHGLHNVLSCLDCLAQSAGKPASISTISVNFPKPVYVGDPAEYFITRQTDEATRLVVETHGVTAATIDLTHDKATIAPLNFSAGAPKKSAPSSAPTDQDLTRIAASIGKKGRMEFYIAAAELFPHSSQWLGSARIAALAALSSIVGMRCPGLHSIFVGFSVDFTDDGGKDCVEFSLLDVDDRFRRIGLGFAGGGLKGTIQALVRMPPILQPTIADLAKDTERLPTVVGRFIRPHDWQCN